MHARSSLLQLAAFPRGGLTPAEAPLIDAEILFRQPQPPQRQVTRWSYKQPITLFLQRNEWCAIDQRHNRVSVRGSADIKSGCVHIHHNGPALRVSTRRVVIVDPSQRGNRG